MESAGTVAGLAFGEIKHFECDPASGIPEMVHLHSISVDPEFRGQGFCKGLVREMIRYCGSSRPMYLNVRMSRETPNVNGVRCYEANGFKVVGVPPVMREDGPNFYMVRPGGRVSRETRTKKPRTKKPKKPKKPRTQKPKKPRTQKPKKPRTQKHT